MLIKMSKEEDTKDGESRHYLHKTQVRKEGLIKIVMNYEANKKIYEDIR